MNLNDLPDMSEALKQVQAFTEKKANDGNLANNAPPYDRVTRRDVITGRLGKDEMGGKRKKHDCAKKVNYKAEEFDVIPEMHTMLEDGTVTHYDITNGEYIYENVPVEELEILISEKHEHFANYDKNAEVLGEGEKPLPKNKMFRKMGNLGRDIVSKHTSDEDRQKKYDRQKKMTRVFNKANEEVEQVDEADSLAAMAARREKRLARQRKQMGTSATGQDFGHDYSISSDERKKRQQAEFDAFVGRGKKTKKEAFAFSEEDFEELEQFSEEIDAMSDAELIDMMEDLILEMAEDDQDLIEICEHLEEVEILSEDYYASAVKASKEASKKPEVKAANRRARVERLKKAAGAAAKKVGSAAKAGAKAAAKGAVRGAGYAAGVAQRAASSAKSEFKKGRERGLKGSGSSKPASSSSSSDSDDDGTDGKLDSVLSSIRGSKGKSSGGGSSSASSGGGAKKKPGLLRRAAGAIGRGLKKAAGKTARAVSSGSDKLAKRLGENYDQIAHLYESGLFTIEEIENVIEEGYKPYPAEKVARKREAVKKKEDIANYQRRDDDANKLYKRGVAMSFKKKMKDVGGN